MRARLMRYGVGCWKKRTGDGGRAARRHAFGGAESDDAVTGAAGHYGRFGRRCDDGPMAHFGIRAGGGRGHPAFGLSGGAFHHAPAVRYVAFGIYRGQPVSGYSAELLGAFARPHHAGGLHGRGHAHGVHGDSARVPPREARYGHGRHRAHHRLRPGGGAVAVGPFG